MATRGGLIAIGGPPLGGRGPLAAMVADSLARTVKLETVDTLTRETFSSGTRQRVVGSAAMESLVAAAVKHLQTTRPRPIVIAVARFEKPADRALAARAAEALGVRFLYVEARSSNIRSIRRLFKLLGPDLDPVRQIVVHEAAVRRYRAVRSDEAVALPCVVLSSVLRDLDAACLAVCNAWYGRS